MNNLNTYQLNMTISTNKDVKEIDILNKLIQFAEDNGYLLGGGLELVDDKTNNIDTPSQEIFDEMKYIATKIWEGYDNSRGYVDEKLSRINSFGNIQDNSMIFYRMFDSHNQEKFRSFSSPEVLDYIKNNL
jgi:hypothetical protein